MPFNADTYYANKYRRHAYAALGSARDIRGREQRGEAHAWEIARVPRLVQEARSMLRLSVLYRTISEHRKRQQKNRISRLT